MNDPHVKALIYAVEHDKSSDYSLAKTIEIEHSTFYLKLKDSEARFELKEHCPTRQQAQQAIRPFIQQWELRASLESGLGTFALRFKQAEIVDLKPTQGVNSIPYPPAAYHLAISSRKVTVSRQYPQPPRERQMNLDNPDVQTMLHRYMGYRRGREYLPSMAYFCCEVFAKRLGKDAKHSANKHKISHKLVKRVSSLASNKGGDQARHQSGICQPLTQCEIQFLERTGWPQ